MVCLDLDELPTLVGRGCPISNHRYAQRSFLRDDHLFGTTPSLADEVRQMIQRETGMSPRGPIRLLTQLRYFGVYMSPLNLYFAYDRSGERVESIVAEVNNTPWNERHCYVLHDQNRTADGLEFSHPKMFHVSPFMGMNIEYQWQLTAPGQDLNVRLANQEHQQVIFDANLNLQRRELTSQQLRRMCRHYPLMTAQISAAIYYQALLLWWKQCPLHTHPRKQKHLTTQPRVSPSSRPTTVSKP